MNYRTAPLDGNRKRYRAARKIVTSTSVPPKVLHSIQKLQTTKFNKSVVASKLPLDHLCCKSKQLRMRKIFNKGSVRIREYDNTPYKENDKQQNETVSPPGRMLVDS